MGTAGIALKYKAIRVPVLFSLFPVETRILSGCSPIPGKVLRALKRPVLPRYLCEGRKTTKAYFFDRDGDGTEFPSFFQSGDSGIRDFLFRCWNRLSCSFVPPSSFPILCQRHLWKTDSPLRQCSRKSSPKQKAECFSLLFRNSCFRFILFV